MIVYIDGSAHPNPGPGGYSLVEIENDKVLFAKSVLFENEVTNNEMELKAALYALIKYGKEETPVIVYSDSAYVVNTFNDWMFNWQKNDWTKGDGKKPENLDLISMYFAYHASGYRIDLRKVKGHNGTFGNEIADKLATGKITPSEVMKLYGKK